MKKRNLFAEIAEGFDALADARAGKQTLRAHDSTAQNRPAARQKTFAEAYAKKCRGSKK